MTDSYNISASTTLTLTENPSMTQQQIKNLCNEYLGLDDYHFIRDPMDDYIHHIDCWAKFLAVDKILIGQVPATDSRYADYEAAAQYFESKLTPWGTKYRIYRVFTPGGGNRTPYTNSLILNDHVFVPIGNNTSYNDAAIAVYQEAMPGYTIVPVASPSSPYQWLNTDALHCRTHEIADIGMLFIRHYPLFDTLEYQDIFTLTADIRPLSGQPLVSDSLLVYYKINDEEIWQTSIFTQPPAKGTHYAAQLVDLPENAKISYYIFAKDESQRREKHPYIGAFDPHVFYTGKKDDGDDTTSVHIHYPEFEVVLYPNPTTGELRIEIAGQARNDAKNIEIFDISGRKLLSHTANPHIIFDISHFESGVYFVKITADSGHSVTKKIIKL
jgi:hypothetical protein